MIKTIYLRSLSVLSRKPFRLWGISLLAILLDLLAYSLFGVVIGIAVAIVLLIDTSMTMIYLSGYRGEEVHVEQLFDCFRDWNTMKRVLCGMAWRELWIFIWALIPIVGPVFAIIRSYEYRLTPYILVTEPDVAPTQAIKISKERTNGWKSKMFWADILVVLIVFAASAILSLLSAIPYIGFLFAIILFLGTICVAVLEPLFLGLVQAAFYEEITNPTVAEQKTEKEEVVHCPECGAANSTANRFCGCCGHKF